MPLSKAFLTELEIDSKTASLIMAEHGRMQTGYLQEIESLKSTIAENEKTAKAQEDALETLKADNAAQLETVNKDWQSKIDTMTMANTLTSMLGEYKSLDNELVTSLLKTDDLNLSDKNFETSVKTRIEELRTARPFLFEAVKEDGADSGNPPGDDAGRRGLVQGKFVQQEQSKPMSYNRLGNESYPDITSIVKF